MAAPVFLASKRRGEWFSIECAAYSYRHRHLAICAEFYSELMLTSNEIFDLEQLPKRLLVIGGGYIATEFAGVFNGLGSEVTQLYRASCSCVGSTTISEVSWRMRFENPESICVLAVKSARYIQWGCVPCGA